MVVGSVRRDQLPPVEGLVDREVSVGPAAGSPRHLGGRRRLLTESSPPLRPTPLPLLLGRGLYSRHFSLYIFCRGLAGRCLRSWAGQDVVAVFLFLSFRPLGALFHARSRLCGPRGRWACRLLPQTPVDPNPAPPRIRCLSQSLNSRSPLEARTTSGPPPKPSRVVKGTATRLPTRAPAGHVASAGRTPLGCGHSAPPPRVRRHPRPCAWAAKGGNGRARRDGGRCGGGHDRSGGGGDKRRRRGGQRRARGR